MNYFLPLKIDNRKYHIAELTPAGGTDPAGLRPSFVIERATGQERPLLSWLGELKLTCRGGFKNDRWINWATLTAEGVAESLRLRVQTNSQPGPPADPLPPLPDLPAGLRLRWQHNRLELLATPALTASLLTVTLTVGVDEQTVEGALQLHLVPQERIYDLVLDFGSEASQLILHRRDGHGNRFLSDRFHIVEQLVEHFYPRLKGKKLHQQTGTDKKLYRSAFFIREKGAVFNPIADPGLAGDEEYLNPLTAEEDKNKLVAERMLVSNLKLADLGAYDFQVTFKSKDTNVFGDAEKDFSHTITQLQQAIVNYFLKSVLKKLESQTHDEIYLAVKLLVANVFEQHKVAGLVNGTAASLPRMAREMPELRLGGLEVSAISESDSAFLGFKREQEERQKQGHASFLEKGKRYLIVDVGKGTTDYSILSVSDTNSELSSVYRSGFVGAGNLISYAFIDTVFAAICGPNEADRRRAIQAVTQRADIAQKLHFTEVIERLKFGYDSDPAKNYADLNQLIDFTTIRGQLFDKNATDTLERIASLLESNVLTGQGSLRDQFGIINNTVKGLADRIHEEVFQSGRATDNARTWLIHKIILTGRGFLFKPLTHALRQAFGEVTAVEASELKKVCLEGAFSGNRINFESNLVGSPAVNKLFGQPGRQSRQIDTGQGKRINVPIYNPLLDRLGPMGKLAQDVWNGFTQSHYEVIQSEELVHPEPARSKPDNANPVVAALTAEERSLNQGYDFLHFNPHEEAINICGIDYKRHTIGSGQVNVFFTGNDFIIRNADTYDLLRVQPGFFQETQAVFQTLYPFQEIEQWEKVSVYQLTDLF